jgi:hypothetical protein
MWSPLIAILCSLGCFRRRLRDASLVHSTYAIRSHYASLRTAHGPRIQPGRVGPPLACRTLPFAQPAPGVRQAESGPRPSSRRVLAPDGKLPEILENADEDLTPRMRNLLALLWNEWKDLEQQLVDLNQEVDRIASSDAACTRLRQIPGIGPLVATAIVAAIGNGAAFRKGCDFAAWMGLVPKQYSTGGKAKLASISKRGNRSVEENRIPFTTLVLSEDPVQSSGYHPKTHVGHPSRRSPSLI